MEDSCRKARPVFYISFYRPIVSYELGEGLIVNRRLCLLTLAIVVLAVSMGSVQAAVTATVTVNPSGTVSLNTTSDVTVHYSSTDNKPAAGILDRLVPNRPERQLDTQRSTAHENNAKPLRQNGPVHVQKARILQVHMDNIEKRVRIQNRLRHSRASPA